MTSKDPIRPGDVYEYLCGNDQGYGYMVPVKTSKGWDFIDTYQLGIPYRKDGETGDDASIRRIIELGHGEHDGYVSQATSLFYYHNVHLRKVGVPDGLRLALNLSDYGVASSRECVDYDDGDVVMFVPLYFEQHYSWHSGRALGLCFVRKGAEKNPVTVFRNLLAEASGSIIKPSASAAAHLLGKVEKELCVLEDFGLSTQEDEDAVFRLAKRIEIISKCVEDLREIDRERMTQRRDSDSTVEERTVGDARD